MGEHFPSDPSPAGASPLEALAAELAYCLTRFATATADEGTMQRAARALHQWEALRSRPAPPRATVVDVRDRMGAGADPARR